MSNSINNRMSLYLSPRKDKDIINALVGVEVGDINYFIKGLLRDGLKYRSGGYYNHQVSPTLQPVKTTNDGDAFSNLADLTIEKKTLTDSEAENKFDLL